MTNPVQPTTPLVLNGIHYALLFDLESVALAEELTDRPLLTGLRQRDIATPTISLVRTMLFACLHANHPKVTFDLAKSLVTRKNWAEIWAAVLGAWSAGLAEADPEEDAVDADPPTDQCSPTPNVG